MRGPPVLTPHLLTPSRCQRAAWKDHKKACRELTLPEVWDKVSLAYEARDWKGVLEWEDRMDAVVAAVDPANGVRFLEYFYGAHFMSRNFAKAALYGERKVDLLGSLKRLRDQGECMGMVATALEDAGDIAGARKWTARARALGESHGFFSVEASACHRLANMVLFLPGERCRIGLVGVCVGVTPQTFAEP